MLILALTLLTFSATPTKWVVDAAIQSITPSNEFARPNGIANNEVEEKDGLASSYLPNKKLNKIYAAAMPYSISSTISESESNNQENNILTRAFLGYPYPRIPATGPYFNDLQMSQLPNNYPAAYHPYIYQHHNLVRRDAEAEPQSSYNDTYVGYRVGMMGLGSFGFKGIMPYMATPFAVWGRPFG